MSSATLPSAATCQLQSFVYRMVRPKKFACVRVTGSDQREPSRAVKGFQEVVFPSDPWCSVWWSPNLNELEPTTYSWLPITRYDPWKVPRLTCETRRVPPPAFLIPLCLGGGPSVRAPPSASSRTLSLFVAPFCATCKVLAGLSFLYSRYDTCVDGLCQRQARNGEVFGETRHPSDSRCATRYKVSLSAVGEGSVGVLRMGLRTKSETAEASSFCRAPCASLDRPSTAFDSEGPRLRVFGGPNG